MGKVSALRHEPALREDLRAVVGLPEVAEMLGYGPTKVRMMVISGDLRSLNLDPPMVLGSWAVVAESGGCGVRAWRWA